MEHSHNYSIHAARYGDKYHENDDVYQDSSSDHNASPLLDHHLFCDSSPLLFSDDKKSFTNNQSNMDSKNNVNS